MKKINIVRSWLIGSFVLFGITSCTAGFEDANRPGHETSLEELGRDDYAVSSFITELQNFAFPEQENTYQNTEDLIGNYLGKSYRGGMCLPKRRLHLMLWLSSHKKRAPCMHWH